jgi:hypothetical protein
MQHNTDNRNKQCDAMGQLLSLPQVREPTMLVHSERGSQPPLLTRHSLMSASKRGENNCRHLAHNAHAERQETDRTSTRTANKTQREHRFAYQRSRQSRCR